MSGNAERTARERADFWSGAVLAALAVFALLWLIPVNVPGSAGDGQVAPSFFPSMAAVVVLICALGLMLVNVRALKAPGDGRGRLLLMEAGGWAVLAVLYFLALKHAGFIPAGIGGVIAGIAITQYRKRLWLAALLAIGLPFLLDAAVWRLFTIQLP